MARAVTETLEGSVSGTSRAEDSTDKVGFLPVAAFSVFLLLLLLVAFAPGIGGEFIMDDIHAIKNNESIRDLSDLRSILLPPSVGGSTHEGRPLLNLSFALNYAISSSPVGFKIGNILIHWMAGLSLAGLVYLLAVQVAKKTSQAAFLLAVATAILWCLHPVTVQSVSYAAQRAESMAGLSMLVALLLAMLAVPWAKRGGPSNTRPLSPRWRAASALGSIACVYAGVLCKEIVVVVPALIFLFDWILVYGSVSVAFRERGWLYLAQLPAVGLAIALLLQSDSRGGTIGTSGEVPITVLEYFGTQVATLPHYIRVCVFPVGLVFDHGLEVQRDAGKILFGAGVLVILVCSSLWARTRYPVYGLCVLVFLVILAPTSTFIPIASQLVSEHRLYLPSSAVVALLVWATTWTPNARPRYLLFFSAALILFVLTLARSWTLHSSKELWADTFRKVPHNRRAYSAHMNHLLTDGELAAAERAIFHSQRSPQTDPLSLIYMAKIQLDRNQSREALRLCLKAQNLLKGEHVDAHTLELFPAWATDVMIRASQQEGLMDQNGTVIRPSSGS